MTQMTQALASMGVNALHGDMSRSFNVYNLLNLVPCSLQHTTEVKQNVPKSNHRTSSCYTPWSTLGYRANHLSAPLGLLLSPTKPMKGGRWVRSQLAADSNKIATDSPRKEFENTGNELSSLPAEKPMPSVQVTESVQAGAGAKNESLTEVKGSDKKSSEAQDETVPSSSSQSLPKRSPLTAREKLRAARVLSKYTESKPPRKELGSNVLDALRESEKGKTRGLPQAPSNMFDDSKRGLPKPGLTFDFPGGADLFFIVFSFVFISTVMFATTYIAWKAGAIHFNEY